jgi:hypothetical protein
MSKDECVKIGFADALRRLPGPQGEHNVALFEHGSLVVKLSRPRGPDLQLPHSRDEIYVVAQGKGEFVCGARGKHFLPQTSCLPRPEQNIVLRTSAMTLRSGFSFMDPKAAKPISPDRSSRPKRETEDHGSISFNKSVFCSPGCGGYASLV